MKKIFFISSLMLVLITSLLGPTSNLSVAHAQTGCVDPATGAPTECPPTDPPTGGGNNNNDDSGGGSGGNQNPPSSVSTPTSTPLPLSNPNENGSTEKPKDWTHTCSPNPNNPLAMANCLLSVGETCQAEGGDAIPGSPGSDGSITVTCTHIVIPPTELPLANPAEDGILEKNKHAQCSGEGAEWLLKCVMDFVNDCGKAGGVSTTSTIDSENIKIDCSVEAFIVVDPASLPIAAPEDNHLGTCNAADGNLRECMDEYQRLCTDGLLVVKVDIYNGVYDFYCIPHETVPQLDLPIALPEGDGTTEDTNWTGGCFGDDVDQCVSNLAALCDEEGGDLSVWYDDEGGAGVYCENSTPADNQSAPTEAPVIAGTPTDDGSGGSSPWLPWIAAGVIGILIGLLLPAVQKVREAAARSQASHTREHVLLNKDDGGTEASDYLLEIDGVKGESKQHIKKATLFVRKSGGDQQD